MLSKREKEAAERRREYVLGEVEAALEGTSGEALAEEVSARVVGQGEAVGDTCRFLVSSLVRMQRLLQGVPAGSLPHLDALMVAGPTGCGKTYMVRLACEKLGLDMYEIDGSSLTGAGWRGGDLEKHVYRLASAQRRVERCRPTVVFVDEADKLARDETGAKGFSPCMNLLKLIEGTGVEEVDGPGSGDPALPLDHDMLVFVLAGAFDGLDAIVRRRLSAEAGGMGFSGDVSARSLGTDELLARAEVDDLMRWGLPRELVGRITSLTRVRSLGTEDLGRIARGAGGSVEERFAAMMPYGCSLSVSGAAASLAAAEAAASGRGARGLESALGAACLEAVEAARGDDDVVSAKLVARGGEVAVEYERGVRPAPPAAEADGEENGAEHGADDGNAPTTAEEEDGWEDARWAPEPTRDLAHVAVAACAAAGGKAGDPVATLRASGRYSDAHALADAIVDTLMRGAGVEPGRARLANELVYGCLALIILHGSERDASARTLRALLEEGASGRLRDRALRLYDGADGEEGAGRDAFSGAEPRKGDVVHHGVDPSRDSALRHLAVFWGLAGNDAEAIAREAAEAVGALVAGGE